jgi:hypothetical protein
MRNLILNTCIAISCILIAILVIEKNVLHQKEKLLTSYFRKNGSSGFPIVNNDVSGSKLAREEWVSLCIKTGVIKTVNDETGIYVVLEKTGSRQAGIYFSKTNEPPEDGSGISFDKMETNIYRFNEKVRQATDGTR